MTFNMLICIAMLAFTSLDFTKAWVKEMENPNLYQGDIVLSPQQMEEIKNGKFRYSSLGNPSRLWPYSEVPYEIGSSLRNNKRAMEAINGAIADYHKYTCIRFVKRSNETYRYVQFYDGKGCHSPLGYEKGRANRLSLGDGCWWKATVLHEIAHTLGVHHEQTRPDRDNYIYINISNIAQASYDRNFAKEQASDIDSQGTPYDYLSMMHYRHTSFARDGRYSAIVTNDPLYQHIIGQRNGFSKIDAEQLNKMYRCSGTYPSPPEFKVVKGCYNSGVGCEDLAYNGKCNSEEFGDYMKRSCRMSCSICAGGMSQKDGPKRTYVVRTDLPPLTTASEICRDTLSNCNSVKFYCGKENSSWKQLLLERCRKTCGYCA